MSRRGKRKTVILILLLLGLLAFTIETVKSTIEYINYPPLVAEDLTRDEKALLEKEFQITLPSDMDITKASYDFEELKIRIKVENDESTRIIYEVLTRLIGLGDSDAKREDRLTHSGIDYKISSGKEPEYKNTDGEKVYSSGILNWNYNEDWSILIKTKFYYGKNGEIITEMVKDRIDNREVLEIFLKRRESQVDKK